MVTKVTRFCMLLAFGSLIGCSGDSPQMPGYCSTEADCGEDMMCEDAACVPADGTDDSETPRTTPPGAGAAVGDSCVEDADCGLNLTCVPDTEGNRICTRACDFQDPTDCHAYDMECKMYQASGETIALCLPRPDVLCQACEFDEDCGGTSQCRVQDDGAACGITCSNTLPCPENYECLPLHDGESNVFQCEPLGGLCDVCVDEDGDGFPAPGMNRHCPDVPVDCDDTRADVNPGAIEVCDGVDNTCDGVIDGPYLNPAGIYYTDANCGTCGNSCFDALGVVAGECVVDNGAASCHATICEDGRLNCDNDAATCDAIESAVTSCGGCGVVCDSTNTSSATCDLDNDDQYECNLTCTTGAEDCDGDTSNGCETVTSDDVNNCGGCGDVCDSAHANNVCVNGGCAIGSCETGWVDLDGEVTNGCEYECTASGMDTPNDLSSGVYDHLSADQNCDGIDGTVSRAWFVDGGSGSDALGDGSMANPFKSIMKAMANISVESPRNHIYVSRGTYTENVVLSDRVGLYGGYDASQGWRRAPANETIIIAASKSQDDSYHSVVGKDLTTSGLTPGGPQLILLHEGTIVQNFTIQGKDASHTLDNQRVGASSVGLACINCPQLRLRGNTIRAGNGASGVVGANGAAGSDGKQGGAGAGTGTKGQAGAAGAECAGSRGGGGGKGGHGNENGSAGDSGSGTAGGGGGGGGDGHGSGNTSRADDGDTGTAGGPGAPAAAGAPGSVDGVMLWGFLRPSVGDTGPTGGHGSGGGGGGGGGGKARNLGSEKVWAGGGGGGGGGGCGGVGGQGGGGGGNSFAIFLASPMPAPANIVGNRLSTGTGGAGAAGGTGGAGGAAADGGIGGSGGHKAGNGGRGGRSGAGGAGGTGGGGPGGSSVAVAGHGQAVTVLNAILSGNTVQSLGNGGAGSGNAATGVVGNTHAF